jgi:chromosome segregation ATPase
MTDTTDIEKKNLEAHVELCAERYRHLETKLETVEEKIITLSQVIREVHDMVAGLKDQRNNQILAWAAGLISLLLGIVGWFLVQFLN